MKTMVQTPDYATAVQDRAAGILEEQIASGYPVRLDAWQLYRQQYGTVPGDDERLAALIGNFATPYPMARLGTLAAAAATSAPGSVLRKQAVEGVQVVEAHFAASFFDNADGEKPLEPVHISAGCRTRSYGNSELVSELVKLARYAGEPALAMDYVERYKWVLGPQYPQMAAHIARDYTATAKSAADLRPARTILGLLKSEFDYLKELTGPIDLAALDRTRLDLGAMLVNLSGSSRRVAEEICAALRSMRPDHPRLQKTEQIVVTEAAYEPGPTESAVSHRFAIALEHVRTCAAQDNKEGGQKIIAESGLDDGDLVPELAAGLVRQDDRSAKEWLERARRNLPGVIDLLTSQITEKNMLKRIQGFRSVMAQLLDAGYPEGVAMAYERGAHNMSGSDGLAERLHYTTQPLVAEAYRQMGNHYTALNVAEGRHLSPATAAVVLGIYVGAAQHRQPSAV